MKTPKFLKRHAELKLFSKYWFGSYVYFWVGYGIFALGYSVLHVGWFPAKIAADIVGWSINYVIQRLWAFSGRIHLKEIEHLSRYLLIESVGFVLDYLIIWGLKAVGISPYIGFIISAAFFTFWSWFWYKYWVFPERRNTKKSA